eukprot:gene15307-858_t
MLSRVQRLSNLYLLRDFDASRLHRSPSKANVDTLLRRLRGELGRHAEGSKHCSGCDTTKPRSQFVDPDARGKAATREWDAGADRKCRVCAADAKEKRRLERLHLECGKCGAKRPRKEFVGGTHVTVAELAALGKGAVCLECKAEGKASGKVRCGKCGKSKPFDAFAKRRVGRAAVAADMVTCTDCGDEKPKKEFSAKTLRDRSKAVCKQCGLRRMREGGSKGSVAAFKQKADALDWRGCKDGKSKPFDAFAKRRVGPAAGFTGGAKAETVCATCVADDVAKREREAALERQRRERDGRAAVAADMVTCTDCGDEKPKKEFSAKTLRD